MTTDKEGNLRKRKYETQEIASNLINDLEDLERILSGPMPNRSRIRSFASILRRLFLQQKELKHIADVRLSGLRISAPDFSPFNLYSGLPLVGFVGGGGVAFDVLMTAASLVQGDQLAIPSGYESGKQTLMSIDSFLSCKTVFWRSTWFSRKEVIDFAANKLGAAHTGSLTNSKERKLKDLCHHGRILLSDGTPSFSISIPSPDLVDAQLTLKSTVIDMVLFEVLSACYFVVKSPDIIQLRALIETELGH